MNFVYAGVTFYFGFNCRGGVPCVKIHFLFRISSRVIFWGISSITWVFYFIFRISIRSKLLFIPFLIIARDVKAGKPYIIYILVWNQRNSNFFSITSFEVFLQFYYFKNGDLSHENNSRQKKRAPEPPSDLKG